MASKSATPRTPVSIPVDELDTEEELLHYATKKLGRIVTKDIYIDQKYCWEEKPDVIDLGALFYFLKHGNKPQCPVLMAPSEFNKNLLTSTPDRYIELVNPLKTYDMPKSNKFKCVPPIVIFQCVEENKAQSINLTVRNVSGTIQPLVLKQKSNECIHVAHTTKMIRTKFAPGMAAYFTVQLTPVEAKDYTYEIEFVSGDENFCVPVAAIGPRSSFDLPDEIKIPESLTKLTSEKVIFTKNIGQKFSNAKLLTEPPFEVGTSTLRIPPMQSVQLVVSCNLNKSGRTTGDLVINSELGESMIVKLEGVATNGNIFLDTSTVGMKNTFPGMCERATITLTNDTKHLVKFSWQRFGSMDKDMMEINKCVELSRSYYAQARFQNMKLKHRELASDELHETICDRILSTDEANIGIEQLRFSHDEVTLDPMEGSIWPNASVKINITYKPIKTGIMSVNAYCEVEGTEDRLPLHIYGSAEGPKIILNVDSVDLGSIYAGAINKYQLLAINEGLIPGTLSYARGRGIFHGSVNCTPNSVVIERGRAEPIIFEYQNFTFGPFFEHIEFLVKESNKALFLTVKGKTIEPAVSFNVDVLNFGTVPQGFPVRKKVLIRNQSVNSISVGLKIRKDGTEPPLTCKEFDEYRKRLSSLTTKTNILKEMKIPKNPRRFNMWPTEITIEANDYAEITVEVVASLLEVFITNIDLYCWNQLLKTVSLELEFDTRFDPLRAIPSEISVDNIFLRQVHTVQVDLMNSSDIPYYYFFIPHQEDCIQYSFRPESGIIRPRSTITTEIKVVVFATDIEPPPVKMFQYCNSKLVYPIKISGRASGPIVINDTPKIDFGEIKIPNQLSQSVHFTNMGPIDALATAKIARKPYFWQLSWTQSTIPARSTKELVVTTKFFDSAVINDELHVHIETNRLLRIALAGEATGHGIILEPVGFGDFNLGSIFIGVPAAVELRIINMSSSDYGLLWMNNPEPKSVSKTYYEKQQGKYIQLKPQKVSVKSGEDIVLVVTSFCSTVQVCEEVYYCFGYEGQCSKRFLIGSIKLKAAFIAHRCEYIPSEINFHIEVSPTSPDPVPCEESFTFIPHFLNKAEINIDIEKPFKFRVSDVLKSNLSVNLETNESVTVIVHFDPVSVVYDNGSVSYQKNIFLSCPDFNFSHNIPVTAKVILPYLTFDKTFIDFGCVQMANHCCQTIHVKNNSPFEVNFQWYWLGTELNITPLDLHKTNEPQDTLKKHETQQCGHLLCKSMKKIIIAVKAEVGEKANVLDSWMDRTHYSTENINELKELFVRFFRKELFPIFHKYLECTAFNEATHDLPDYVEGSLASYSIDITPFCGTIYSNEEAIFTVSFRPVCEMKLSSWAVCAVNGGIFESISIEASCHPIKYELSRTKIDFLFQPFCEIWSQQITLKNIGLAPFAYKIHITGTILEEMARLKSQSLCVLPARQTLYPDEIAELTVYYYHGLIGPVHRSFNIEIAHMNPIEITISGYAICYQLYIDLPKVDYFKTGSSNIVDEYAAIGILSSPWFQQEVSSQTQADDVPCTDFSTITFQNPGNDWHIINPMDELIPSQLSIEMAVERNIFIKYIEQYRSYLSFHAKPIHEEGKTKSDDVLENLNLHGYLLDFGYVIADTKAKCEIGITNAGYLPVRLSLDYSQPLKQLNLIGFHIKSIPKRIGKNQNVFLDITYQPTSENMNGYENMVHFTLNIKIHCGPKIPIYISATAVIPRLTVQSTIDFGLVRCGYQKVLTIPLKNEGRVPVEWTWVIKPGKKEPKTKQKPPTPFVVVRAGSPTVPKSVSFMEIMFKPMIGGSFTRILEIKMNYNNKPATVKVKGTAEKPVLRISMMSCNFEACAPYSRRECTWTVNNSNNFPVEVVFPFQDQWFQEENKIIDALTLYYRSDELCVDGTFHSTNMANEIRLAYKRLIEIAFAELTKKEMKRQTKPATMSLSSEEVEEEEEIDEEEEEEEPKDSRSASTKAIEQTVSQVLSHVSSLPKALDINAVYINTLRCIKDQFQTPEAIHDVVLSYISELGRKVKRGNLFSDKVLETVRKYSTESVKSHKSIKSGSSRGKSPKNLV